MLYNGKGYGKVTKWKFSEAERNVRLLVKPQFFDHNGTKILLIKSDGKEMKFHRIHNLRKQSQQGIHYDPLDQQL